MVSYDPMAQLRPNLMRIFLFICYSVIKERGGDDLLHCLEVVKISLRRYIVVTFDITTVILVSCLGKGLDNILEK